MHEFAAVLTGRHTQLALLHRFLDSWTSHDAAGIPVFIVVPDEDLHAMSESVRGKAEVIPASAVGSLDAQAIFLAFGELGLARHYLVADPHAVMLRAFDLTDFFAAPGVPYLFLSEEHESRVDPEFYAQHGAARDSARAEARSFLGLPDGPLRACGAMGIISTDELAGLRAFWAERNLDLPAALGICPEALAWYGLWLEFAARGTSVEREPIFKDLRTRAQRVEASLKGLTPADVARGYVGVLDGPIGAEYWSRTETRAELVAETMHSRTLTKALAGRVLRRAPRVQRMLGLRT